MRQRLRLPLRRLRLWRLRLRRLRLLLVVGSLPHLLGSTTLRLGRQTQVVMAGLTRLDPANYVLFSAPDDGRVDGES
jgi:hypothetical protein